MTTITSQAESIRRLLESELSTRVRIALFGQPGSGKSSIINALAGRKLAEVDARTDTTVGATTYDLGWAQFTDLPGYGTARFPADTYFERFEVLKFDLLLCVTSGKLTSSDTLFASRLRRGNKVCVIVVNKADTIWQHDKTLDELKHTIANDRRSEIGDHQVKVLFTSCKDNAGISELSEAIRCNVEPAKAERWTRSAKAYSQAFLDRKRDACDRIATYYSLAAAANALNPIPVVDIAVDIGVLMQGFASVRETFGLTDTKLSAVAAVAPALKPLAHTIVEQGTRAGLTALLKSLVKGTTARRLAKYVPIVGQAVAAAAAYGYTSKAIEAYIDECHELASGILKYELEARKAVPS